MEDKNRQLLFSITKKDLEITWYASSGPGGQKKNKTRNACRIRHPDSGVLVTASERRERQRNLRAALERLVAHPKFKIWHAKKCHEVLKGITLEEEIDQMLKNDPIRIEIRKEDKWTEVLEDELT